MATTDPPAPTLVERLAAALRALAAAGAPVPGTTDGSVLRESAHTAAAVSAVQMRPSRWLPDGTPDPTSYAPVPEELPPMLTLIRSVFARLAGLIVALLGVTSSALASAADLGDRIVWQRARGVIEHRRPTRWLEDGTPDPDSYVLVSPPEVTYNLVTNAGRDFLHVQGYGSSGLGANGLNYIALSNDTVSEGAGSTTLSNEIAANGLSRAQGTVAHTGGATTTTITKVFTATGTQSAQKAALFTASSSGTMCHVLGFTQRNLINGDTLTVQFTITLSE